MVFIELQKINGQKIWINAGNIESMVDIPEEKESALCPTPFPEHTRLIVGGILHCVLDSSEDILTKLQATKAE